MYSYDVKIKLLHGGMHLTILLACLLAVKFCVKIFVTGSLFLIKYFVPIENILLSLMSLINGIRSHCKVDLCGYAQACLLQHSRCKLKECTQSFTIIII